MIAYERPKREAKQNYKPRPTLYRDPLDHHCNKYEVEPHILYDPNMVTCYVNTSDVFLLGITIYLNSSFKRLMKQGNSEIGPLGF